MFTIIFYKDRFAFLLNEMQKFWHSDDISATSKMRLTRFFILWLTLMEIVVIFRMLVTNELNVYCVIPNWDYFNYSTIKIIQLIYTFYIYFIVLGFDVLLLCLCIYLQNQFKLLGSKLESTINVESEMKDQILPICIEHHIVLLK